MKQIVDFSQDDQGGATIQVFVLEEDPQTHIETIKALIQDGAIIQSADADSIRAEYRGSNQDKLLSLMADGWSFSGHGEERPQCLCERGKVPCDIRDTNGPVIEENGSI